MKHAKKLGKLMCNGGDAEFCSEWLGPNKPAAWARLTILELVHGPLSKELGHTIILNVTVSVASVPLQVSAPYS
ncbi:3800_t:CDS:1, partial [Acaulospora colombiana]